MTFELKDIVPWGRNLNEYITMFNLTESELNKSIISIGDGPASFNSELKDRSRVISIDPIYKFSSREIKSRIEEARPHILSQLQINKNKFVWGRVKNIEELEKLRLKAMNNFLKDFEKGKIEKRYIGHEMPNVLNFENNHFDLGLSSHFLILYSQLGLDFHLASINEMLRLAKEVRIFPIINLNGEKTELLKDLIDHYEKTIMVRIVKTDYEFQKGGNEMLVLKNN